tara:strand:+ start:488 stop:1135 length:648 start_codon:yes stop_codon:yes gene_type:complete
MSENKIQVYKPFGPSIAKVTIPEDLIKKLNEYVDKIILDENKSKELDWGKRLAGNVKQEFKLEPKFCDKSGFSNFLVKAVSKWIELSERKKITKLEIVSSWVVRQFQNEYNPVHHHSGHVSGVGYLKVPKNFGKTFQSSKKSNANGHLSLIHGNRMFSSESVFDIEPKVGDFYFFPNYLMHTVYPFYESNEERRSISFNAKIDENIYNVYGTSNL